MEYFQQAENDFFPGFFDSILLTAPNAGQDTLAYLLKTHTFPQIISIITQQKNLFR